jgi:hypothetical protein
MSATLVELTAAWQLMHRLQFNDSLIQQQLPNSSDTVLPQCWFERKLITGMESSP